MDLYQVLHVDPKADIHVIEAAYQSLSNYYQSLQNPSTDENEKYREIKNAFDILSNTQKRRQYDEKRFKPEREGNSTDENRYVRFTTTYPNIRPINITEESLGPGICQNCGSVGIVKKAAIRRHIGALIIRFTAKTSGPLCRDCISQYFWKYTATMLYIGWWTPRSIFFVLYYFFANIYNYFYSFTLPRISGERKSSLIWQVLFFGFFALVFYFIFGLPNLT